jgi:hypothetical protein
MAWLLVGLVWYSHLRIPRVVVLRDNILRCQRPIGSVEISLSDIQEIDCRRWNRGLAAIPTRRQHISFLRAMPGLFDILSTIATEHPGLTVRGKLSPYAW